MNKYLCKVCGVEFEVPLGEEAVCPVCGVTDDDVELVKEEQ